jgi:phenylalanine-4-hydroxylase
MGVEGAIEGAASVRRSSRPPASQRLPVAWERYFVPQRYSSYGSAAHQTWHKLVDRTASLVAELQAWLHPAYVAGFRRLVARWARLPRLAQVNEDLAEFGWRAVCVDGYLPPRVYANLLARRVFPVARRIRRPEHVDFSPVPDFAHDLLGHAPMFVSVEHRRFLRILAASMAQAESNGLDQELYSATRESARLRCRLRCPPDVLEAAEARVARTREGLTRRPSALTELGRLYLWSIEFGLMGTPDDFRVYGAGLLSSPAETRAVCLGHAPVRKLSVAAVHRDIRFSDLQTTYYVAPDYTHLQRVLNSLQSRWAA